MRARIIARRADARPMSVPAKAMRMRDEIPAGDRPLAENPTFCPAARCRAGNGSSGKALFARSAAVCLQTVHYPQDTFFLRRNIFSSD
jgi:hypothetical protein